MKHKERLLIVDDSSLSIRILREALDGDYEIDTAKSGEAALEMAKSSTPPDLILLDIIMPEMDGYEVLQKLKEDETTREIPVIFVTSKEGSSDEAKGFELGAVDYIAKPISPPVVKARVKTHLDLKRSLKIQREQNERLEEMNQVLHDLNKVNDEILKRYRNE